MMKLRTAAHSVLLVALFALSACNNPPTPKVATTPPADPVALSASFVSAKLSGTSGVLLSDEVIA